MIQADTAIARHHNCSLFVLLRQIGLPCPAARLSRHFNGRLCAIQPASRTARCGAAVVTFASRSRFLEYTLDFETRLVAAQKVKPGPGLLVFCGNGVRWHRSNLEDFADYYHAGKHRQDDPFAKMEKYHIEQQKLQLLRNVDNFGCLVRPMEMVEKTNFVWPVRGPSFGGVVK